MSRGDESDTARTVSDRRNGEEANRRPSLGVSLRRAISIPDVACAAHVRSVDSDEEDGSFEDAPVVAASVFQGSHSLGRL